MAVEQPAGVVVRYGRDGHEVSFERDALGRVVCERQEAFGRSFAVFTEYDLLGEVRRRSTSDGHSIDWTYDDASRRLTTQLDSAVTMSTYHDVLGSEARKILPGGGQIDARYDPDGRMLARMVARAGSAPAGPAWTGATSSAGATVEQRYSFTPSGNLAAVWDAGHGVVEMHYDGLDQLTAAVPKQATGLVRQLAYDAAGNLTETTPGADVRVHGAGGKLERKGRLELSWDPRGCLSRMSERTDSGQEVSTHFHFGATGLLDAIDLPDGRRIEHAYDPFARRLRKTVLSAGPGARRALSTTSYFWDGMTLATEVRVDEHGAERTRVYCFDGNRFPVAHRTTSQEGDVLREEPWRFYLNDPLTGYPERYADNQPTCVIDLDGLIYSEITDPGPPPKTYKGWSKDDKDPGKPPSTPVPPWISDKPCAEAQALSQMAGDIQSDIRKEQKSVPVKQRLDEKGIEAETKKRMQEKFEKGASAETWEKSDKRERVDPCERCGKMFRDLGITGGVVGAKGVRGSFGVYKRKR